MATSTHNIVHANDIQDILRDFMNGLLENPDRADKIPAVMIWGPPGVGKSTVVKTLAKEMGVGFVDIRLAQMESIDIRGLPVPDKEKKNVQWLPSSIFPTDNTKGGIIFLDELSACPKDVQVAAYELILDRQLGGGDIYKVPNKWLIVAAGNRAEDGAVSTTMSSALTSRMMHVELEADANEWSEWAISHDVYPTVAGFIKFKPKMLFDMEERNLQGGFPTPRTWERVSETCKMIKNETRLRKAVAGLVGVAAAREFMEFHKMSSQMDSVLDMMLNEKKKVVIPTRDDLKYVMTSAMVYHIWRGKTEEETKKLVGGFLRIAMELPPAFSVTAMTAARSGGDRITKIEAAMKIMRHPNYKEWKSKFGQNLNDSYEV